MLILTKAPPDTLTAQFELLLTQGCPKILLVDPVPLFSPSSMAALLLTQKNILNMPPTPGCYSPFLHTLSLVNLASLQKVKKGELWKIIPLLLVPGENREVETSSFNPLSRLNIYMGWVSREAVYARVGDFWVKSYFSQKRTPHRDENSFNQSLRAEWTAPFISVFSLPVTSASARVSPHSLLASPASLSPNAVPAQRLPFQHLHLER